MRVAFSILLMLLFSAGLLAQSQLRFNTYFGKIAKHRSDLLYETPPFSYGLELCYSQRTSGELAWHQRWKRPSYEVSFIHYYLGDNEVLGSLTGIIPSIGFYIHEKEKSSFRFHLGIGIAYVTKSFDEIYNPTNNAIGSNINSIINFKFSHEWQLNDKLDFYTGLSFTHFSNGKTTSPNSGINLPALFVGTAFKLNGNYTGVDEEQKERHSYRKWGINAHVAYGIKENDVPGGPKYPVKILSIGGLFSTDAFNRIVFGWEYEYHEEEYSFAIATFLEEEQAQKEAKKQIIYIGDEALFGNISVRFQLGYYIVNTRTQSINTKLFVNYRIPVPRLSSTFYAGFMMKTYLAKANYLSLVAGYEF
jgi:hypothetical protein